jgi:hypothetical protein
MKIRQVEAELLFHAEGRKDGRTDMTKDKQSVFRNFAEAPK